jgi:hypothetical protein
MERANLYMGLVRRNIEMAPMRILGFRKRLLPLRLRDRAATRWTTVQHYASWRRDENLAKMSA